jgi:signal-transduction protein with cAMP-binding, CBS, and nucleotidyltransferase domain
LLNSSLLRKSLDTDIISSCLNSFNVFKDLLVGLTEQKNLIIRDICRNIDLKYYRDGDIVYDVGDKVGELYFCISGKVSICILE